jgi:Tfp pilus assembly protein PilF
MVNQTKDESRMKRVRTEQAIQFAMQSRWDDAISANRAIINVFPEDAEAWNRLGKALGETGKIKEAREAYQKSLTFDPANGIARKNLERLAAAKSKAEPDKAHQVDASLFIEEMGKTGVTTLHHVNIKMLATLSAGDEVAIKPAGSRLALETMAGEYISDIEPKLAMRLSKLIDGGNKYAAAIAGIRDQSVRVIIKETFQHPTQVGRLSFPAGKAGDAIRPYTKESLVRGDFDDDEDVAEEPDEWEDAEIEVDAEAEPREMGLFDAARAEEHDDTDFDE